MLEFKENSKVIFKLLNLSYFAMFEWMKQAKTEIGQIVTQIWGYLMLVPVTAEKINHDKLKLKT